MTTDIWDRLKTWLKHYTIEADNDPEFIKGVGWMHNDITMKMKELEPDVFEDELCTHNCSFCKETRYLNMKKRKLENAVVKCVKE
jgi:hypothetical protein